MLVREGSIANEDSVLSALRLCLAELLKSKSIVCQKLSTETTKFWNLRQPKNGLGKHAAVDYQEFSLNGSIKHCRVLKEKNSVVIRI